MPAEKELEAEDTRSPNSNRLAFAVTILVVLGLVGIQIYRMPSTEKHDLNPLRLNIKLSAEEPGELWVLNENNVDCFNLTVYVNGTPGVDAYEYHVTEPLHPSTGVRCRLWEFTRHGEYFDPTANKVRRVTLTSPGHEPIQLDAP